MTRTIGRAALLLLAGGLVSGAWAAPGISSAAQSGSTDLKQETPAATDSLTTIDVIAASQIIGRDLRDPSGADAGTIQSLVIDTRTGVVDFVIVGSSGNFDTNGGLVAVPWPALQPPNAGNGPIAIRVSAKKVLDSPRISQALMNNLSQPGYRSRIYGYYGYPYPGYYRNGYGYGPYGPLDYRLPPRGYGPYPGSGPNPFRTAGQAHEIQPGARVAQNGGNAGAQMGAPAAAANANSASQPANAEAADQNTSGLLVSRNGIVSTLNERGTTSSNALRNATVYSWTGETVGDINQMMIDPDRGEVAFVLLTRGGFLGLDQRWYALPVEALVPAPYQGGYRLTVNARTLLQEPGFTVNQNNLPTQVSAAQLASLYQRFGMQPYWEQTRQQKIAEQKRARQQNSERPRSPNDAVDAGGQSSGEPASK